MARHAFFPSIFLHVFIAVLCVKFIVFNTSDLHVSAIEYVKSHHVKELIQNYITLNDNQLRSMLRPGFPLHRFRSAVSDLKTSFEELESKISPYLHIIKKPLPVSPPSISSNTAQPSLASTTPQKKKLIQNKEELLWQWVTRNGGSANGIKLKPVKAFGRGIVAQEDFTKGAPVALISRKCIIRAGLTIAKSKNCKKLYEEWTKENSENIMKTKTHQTMDKALIAMYLLEEKAKGKVSFFHPYVDMLPPTVDYVPVTWSAEEVENWFQGSFMVPAIKSRRNDLHNEYYQGVLSVLPEFRHRLGFTFEDYLWARVIVATRAFRIYIHGPLDAIEEKSMSANSQIVLVPIADLLNHKKKPQTEWTFNVALNAFTLTATQRISANSPVYDSYGDKSNFEFLLNFGFTSHDGRQKLHFSITKDDLQLADEPLWAAKFGNGNGNNNDNQDYRRKHGMANSLVNLADGGGGKSKNILDKPYLKKYLLQETIDRPFLSLVAYLRNEGQSKDAWKDRTGEFALQIISKKLKLMEESYATTLDQDRHIYETKDFSTLELLESNPYKKYVHALKLRIQEKQIIRKLIALSTKNLAFLNFFPRVNIVVIQDHWTNQVIVPTDLVHNIDQNGDLRVGSEVIARWKGGSKYYEASVSQANKDGTYNLYYWDGDVELNVEKKRISWLYDCHIRRRTVRYTINSVIQQRLMKYLHIADASSTNVVDDANGNLGVVDESTGLAMKVLKKTCYQYRPKNNFWAYEFCPGKHVIQFHEERTVPNDKNTIQRTQTINLGRYDKRNNGGARHTQLETSDAFEEWYTNGDGGRVTTIQYVCMPSSDDMIRIATKALYEDNFLLEKEANEWMNPSCTEGCAPNFPVLVEHVLDNFRYVIYVKHSEHVRDIIKVMMHNKVSGPKETKSVTLIFDGKVLSHDTPIKDAGLKEGDVVYYSIEDISTGEVVLPYNDDPPASTANSYMQKETSEKELPILFTNKDNRIANITEPAQLTYIISFLSPLACVKDNFKEKYLKEEGKVLNFNNDPVASGVDIGDFCYAYTNRNKNGVVEYNSGHITNINNDGTLSVQFDNGRFSEKVMAQNILVFDED